MTFHTAFLLFDIGIVAHAIKRRVIKEVSAYSLRFVVATCKGNELLICIKRKLYLSNKFVDMTIQVRCGIAE